MQSSFDHASLCQSILVASTLYSALYFYRDEHLLEAMETDPGSEIRPDGTDPSLQLRSGFGFGTMVLIGIGISILSQADKGWLSVSMALEPGIGFNAGRLLAMLLRSRRRI